MNGGRLAICVIGAGPRGLSVIERICANERADRRQDAVLVHVVDPHPPGAGAVWRTDQSRHLLMNTIASQVTMYTDASNRIAGTIAPGPSLYEWAKAGAIDGLVDGSTMDVRTLAEARELEPDDYPTRALYGRYLQDTFHRVIRTAPAHITFQVHRSRAVALADIDGMTGGRQGIRLADGTRVHGLDAVVLALGHLPALPTPAEARAASMARIHHLTYVPPANPADVDLSPVSPGETVLLRGLGLTFFDYVALLTTGRGGTFGRTGDELVYRPSGTEPRLVASSRRGVPHRARGHNQKGVGGRHEPLFLTPATIAELRRRATGGPGLRFAADVWPLIAREVEGVYYTALLAARGQAANRAAFVRQFTVLPHGVDLTDLLTDFGLADEPWDWDALLHPVAGHTFADRPAFRRWVLRHLREDLRQAQVGNVRGPVAAALDALRDLRNEIRLVVDHGGLEGASRRIELEGWYTPINAALSIGPPASRVAELIALIRAGVVELTGPQTETRINPERGCFTALSPSVPGPPVHARVLIEARLPGSDIRRTADPLLRFLQDTEQATPYRLPTADGGSYETGGLAVTPRPYHLVDGTGQAHPRRFAFGVPTESVHWVTAAGIRPLVDSVTLSDSDAIALTILRLSALCPPRRVDRTDNDLMGMIV